MSNYWIQSYSGNKWDLLDLDPAEVCIDGVAHSLARICRFTGSTSHHYSVAEHACHVSTALPAELRLLGLMHDAAEVIIGDIASPLKRMLTVSTPGGLVAAKDFELGLLDVILTKFGIARPADGWLDVMAMDRRMLATEAYQVYPRGVFESRQGEWGPLPKPLPVKLHFWSANQAKFEFIEQFNILRQK